MMMKLPYSLWSSFRPIRYLPFLVVLVTILGSSAAFVQGQGEDDQKARAVVAASIQAMGGEAYLNVNSVTSSGRYFRFRKGRKAFSRYWDWTVYDPIKWRFQLGEGKRQFVQIYNLELGKAWTLEGKSTVEEVPEESIDDFRDSSKRDIDLIFKKRLDEEGMALFYYGSDDIAGEGNYEAVEFIDATNAAVVVFFDLESHLPMKLETHFTDKMGVRHKQEQEFSNWHVISGVRFPLRHDVYVDDEISSQRFIEELIVVSQIQADLFAEPVPEKKD